MSRSSDATAQLSVLDRLISDEPEGLRRRIRQEESIRTAKDALKRDLSWLLNTRQVDSPPRDGRYDELLNSVYMYGMPDLTALSGDDPAVLAALQRRIEECLRIFEPRLSQVRVTPVLDDDDNPQTLQFRMSGTLNLDAVPEHVVIDTFLDVSVGAVTFK